MGIDANPIGAEAALIALIVVDALSAVLRDVKPRRALAVKTTGGVPTSASLTLSLGALVDVDTIVGGIQFKAVIAITAVTYVPL